MERIMSVEDKIRRAEEIYYKRREQDIPMRDMTRISYREKKNIKLLKRMIRQVIVCLFIYGIFYMIVNNNYIFSEDFTDKAKEILSQDINFAQLYSEVSKQILNVYNKIENVKIKQEKDTNLEDKEKSQSEISNNDDNIGGGEEILVTPESEDLNLSKVENETKELSQMEQDANYIKDTINFIKPVEGVISSAFGWRNPTTETVPKNHTGIDIAAEKGTRIVSATDGKVILASSTGDYGKHLKIQIDDVIIVYAHCNKLYVNEGNTIIQGQEIAEVGSTGNATGPHLHFEVRYQNRYVNPQLVLEL